MRIRTLTTAAVFLLALASPGAALDLPPHPRLYLTTAGGDHVMSLDRLKARAKSPAFKDAWSRATVSSNSADRALVWLISGDTTGLATVRKAFGRSVRNYNQLMELSLAFDWAWGALTDAERKQFAAVLMAGANALAEHYRIPTVYHNMCRGRNMGQGLAMLAAWDDSPEAAGYEELVTRELGDFLEITGDGKRLDDMDGRAGWGGGWPEGYDYDRHGSLYALELLLGWRSCGLGDYLSGSTFWRDKVDWLVYGTGPDGSFIDGYEDNDWPFPMPHDRKMMTFLEGEFHSGLASWWIDTWTDTLNAPAYWDLILADPEVKNTPPDNLPASHLVPGVGLVQMRSSWGRDATFVHFHCGPWYTYHQHVAQGSFTVWRGRHLVVEPGVYNGEVDGHYVNWRIRTISHNSITVFDENERFLGPGDVPNPANDGGQIIQEWTHKPATAAEWRAQRKLRDTGRIVSFLTDPSHDYVEGDPAGGYNPTKVLSWRRQMVFVKPDWLVIRDVVEGGESSFPKALRIHTPEELTLDGRVARTTGTGAPLKIWSLLPAESGTAIAGGPGKTFTYGGHDWTGVEQYNNQFGTAWRLEVTQNSGRITEFLTVLDLAAAGEPQAALDNSVAGATAVTLGGGRYRVAFSEKPGERYAVTGDGISYALSGTVSDGGMPVAGAKITLSGKTSATATSDRHGNYAFGSLSPGDYTVVLAGTGKSGKVTITDCSVGGVNFE